MEQYDIKKTAAELANSAGIGVTAILLFAILSFQRAFPPAWMIAGCVMFGVAVRQTAYFLLVPWYMSRYGQRAVEAEPCPELVFPVDSEPKWIILPSWFGRIDWSALVGHLRNEEQPTLSRRTMIDYVDQRAYSPLDGGQSFPEFMVAIGAAQRTGSSYEWLFDASVIIEELLREFPPTPPTNHQAGSITG